MLRVTRCSNQSYLFILDKTKTLANAKHSNLFCPTVKAHLHYGKNCTRLVGFKEQKNNLVQYSP